MTAATEQSAAPDAGDTRRVLLVVPHPVPPNDDLLIWSYDLSGILYEIAGDGPSPALDRLFFAGGEDGAVRKYFDADEETEVRTLDPAAALAECDFQTRESLRTFVADLRERLDRAASESGGPRWARRFGDLWWMTELSTRNSPGEPCWWELFRVAAVDRLLASGEYAACEWVGGGPLEDLAWQACARHGINGPHIPRKVRRPSLVRLAATRALGAATTIAAVAMARWRARRPSVEGPRARDGREPTGVLAYTWYPRVWTRRYDVWQDMYYGGMAGELEERFGLPVTWALRIYDRTRFLHPRTYRDRLRRLDGPDAPPGRGVVLEAFGGVFDTLLRYLDPRDLFRFWRMTRTTAYRDAFQWEGLDLRSLLEPYLWRSAFTSWPHLELLRRRAARAARRLRPKVVLAYCFEYVYGRAIIEGTRMGSPETRIVGMQHGPITPMKLLYASSPRERRPLPSGAPSLPEPDVYALDGETARRIMAESGVPAEALRTPGAARFDSVWQRASAVPPRADRSGRNRVLIAPGLHDTRSVLSTVFAGLAGDPRLELLVKAHPKVSTEAVMEMVRAMSGPDGAEGEGAAIEVVREGDIYAWMERSDIFVATYSSAGVEAIAFGLPVVLLIPSGTPDMSLYKGHAAPVLAAHGPEDLRRRVDGLLQDPEAAREYVSALREVLADSFGEADGSASGRLAAICAELAGVAGHASAS